MTPTEHETWNNLIAPTKRGCWNCSFRADSSILCSLPYHECNGYTTPVHERMPEAERQQKWLRRWKWDGKTY